MMSLRPHIISLTLACSTFATSKSDEPSAWRATAVSTPTAIGEEIVVLTNTERKTSGLAALVRNSAGENVAEGHPSAAAVVAGWMASPEHRANIVSTHFTEMGAGAATAKNGRRFYAQVFGAPR
ncbi:MAG: CAP domain-containing protein [bacterium]